MDLDVVEVADLDREAELDLRSGLRPVGPQDGIARSGRVVIRGERRRETGRAHPQPRPGVDEARGPPRLLRGPLRQDEALRRLEGEREPLRDGRKIGKGPMRLGLIPVRDRGEMIPAVVRVAVLDRHLDGLRERDRVGDVEAVDRGLGARLEVLFLEGTAVEGALALAHAPGVGVIVLRTRAVERRPVLAVDPDHVVALAPPAQGPLEHAEVRADEMPGPFGGEEEIVPVLVRREVLPVLGVEIRRVGGEIGELAVIDVIVERVDGPRPLVLDRDPARLAEGQEPVAVPGPPLRRARDRQRDEVPVQAVPDAEEVADGRLDRRGFLAVPVDPEDDLPAVERLGGDRRPDVVDGGGAVDLGQDGGLPRPDDDRVAVPAARGRRTRRGGSGSPASARGLRAGPAPGSAAAAASSRTTAGAKRGSRTDLPGSGGSGFHHRDLLDVGAAPRRASARDAPLFYCRRSGSGTSGPAGYRA